MRQATLHSNVEPSRLVSEHLELLQRHRQNLPVLDLACGHGRNGLFLARQGVPVVFADRDATALASIREALQAGNCAGDVECVDLETGDPLAGRNFGAVLVFNYLHRPLIGSLRRAVSPGGVVLYETFTRPQAAIGKPGNPDFLLKPGELDSWFQDWCIVARFEGEERDQQGAVKRAYASLVAIKPSVSQAGRPGTELSSGSNQ